MTESVVNRSDFDDITHYTKMCKMDDSLYCELKEFENPVPCKDGFIFGKVTNYECAEELAAEINKNHCRWSEYLVSTVEIKDKVYLCILPKENQMSKVFFTKDFFSSLIRIGSSRLYL